MLCKCAYCLHGASIIIMPGNYPQVNALRHNIINDVCAAVRQKCIYTCFINIVKLWTWLMLQVSRKHLDASQRRPKCWNSPCRKLSEREVFEFWNWGRLLSEEECKYTLLDRVKTEKHIFLYLWTENIKNWSINPFKLDFFSPVTRKIYSLLYPSSM